MSQDELDVIRRWIDAWNGGDIDAWADLFDPNAEAITDPSWMEAGPFKGRAAIREWFEALEESWDRHGKVVLRELFEVGDNVVARWDWTARGRASGIEFSLDVTSVNVIEKGKIVRQQYYLDHATALKAVGLSE
jgi:ketosteroid isomerase-like protein